MFLSCRTVELTYRRWTFRVAQNFTKFGIIFPVRLSDWLCNVPSINL
ncbi:hypothetical protein D1AOALGA4SA_11868 [Olavius algarvensis Delta 1 endosymbiont]|nr:hypothetical protein D1AOALGA4SA_11868 [Olavius algarvensis Delta 1 endosymbiont]